MKSVICHKCIQGTGHLPERVKIDCYDMPPAASLYAQQQHHNHHHLQSQICIKYSIPDAVPPIHTKSYHVATDKDPSKLRSIFSDNLQPIATCGKKARGTLLVDHNWSICGNGGSIKRAPLSVSYYNKISCGHIGQGVVRRCSDGLVLPLCLHSPAAVPLLVFI